MQSAHVESGRWVSAGNVDGSEGCNLRSDRGVEVGDRLHAADQNGRSAVASHSGSRPAKDAMCNFRVAEAGIEFIPITFGLSESRRKDYAK